MLKQTKVTIHGQDFDIASLNVRQFGALMDARKTLYGDAGTAKEIMEKNVATEDMLNLEATFIVVPSLNNAARLTQSNVKQLRGAETFADAPGGPAPALVWTADRLLDELDHQTFRDLVTEIMKFIGLRVETDPVKAAAQEGESLAATVS